LHATATARNARCLRLSSDGTSPLRSEPRVATAAKRWCSVSHYFSRCRRLEPIQRTFLRTERIGSAGSFVRSRPDSNRRPPCGLPAWSPDRNQNARPIARPPPRGLPTWSDAQIPRATIRSSSDGDKPRRDEERFAYARWLRLSSDGDEPRRNVRRYQEKQAGETRTGIAFRPGETRTGIAFRQATRRNKDRHEKQGQALRFDRLRNAFIAWALHARAIRPALPVSSPTTSPRFSLLAILHFRIRYHACPCFPDGDGASGRCVESLLRLGDSSRVICADRSCSLPSLCTEWIEGKAMRRVASV